MVVVVLLRVLSEDVMKFNTIDLTNLVLATITPFTEV